jgi:hypothetical protein
MNYFLELKIHEKDRTILVRPEHVAAVQRDGDYEYDVIIMCTGDTFWVERGQFSVNKLINHTGHAGMRVL